MKAEQDEGFKQITKHTATPTRRAAFGVFSRKMRIKWAKAFKYSLMRSNGIRPTKVICLEY